MTRLRISLALAFSLAPLVLSGQEIDTKDPGISRRFDAEVTQTSEEIFKYVDANGDGVLNYPETIQARSQVAEAMVDRLPSSSYISGGETMIRMLRQKISQQAMDTNADRRVDPIEFGNFIGYALAESEKTLRTSPDTQFRLMMEETESNIKRYTWELEEERRKRDQWKWHAKAVQQRQQTWFEVQARLRVMRSEAERDIAEARAKADREAIEKENSPGIIPK